MVCAGCDETFLREVTRRVQSDLGEDVLRARLEAAVHRARSRGASSVAAISRFVLLMFALEPDFDRRHRVKEHLDGFPNALDAALLSLETGGHPNCWYRADPVDVEARWQALMQADIPHTHSHTRNDQCDSAALPMQLSPDYGIQLDAPYVETPYDVVRAMLDLAQVGPADTVLDLGSGDGRIVITAAAEYGARSVGIDLNADNISFAREAAARAGVSDRATFRRGDLFDADFSSATVVTLYLLRHVNLMLRDRLRAELPRGARIVSRHFDMGDWPPDARVGDANVPIYCWRVGAKTTS